MNDWWSFEKEFSIFDGRKVYRWKYSFKRKIKTLHRYVSDKQLFGLVCRVGVGRPIPEILEYLDSDRTGNFLFTEEPETGEIWLDIPGWEGAYQASTLGRIRSCDRYVWNSRGHWQFLKSRILTPQVSRGYLMVSLSLSDIIKGCTVHSLVAATFLGPRPEGCQVNHIDGVKRNNCLKNLEYVTPSQNIKHAERLGLRKPFGFKGEAVPSAKLRNVDIPVIRQRLADGEPQRAIARDFGVDQRVINLIGQEKLWTHVP